MERLVEALVERLPAERLWTSARVESLSRTRAGESFRLRLQDGREILAGAVILACPAPAAAQQLTDLAPELARELVKLRYAACATVNLVYSADDVVRPPRSSGFFVPRAERSALVACSFVSVKFEGRVPDGKVLLRAFLGGAARPPEVLDGDDSEIAERAHLALARAVGLRASPQVVRVHRYPRGMPQFDVGHLEWLARVKRESGRLSGVSLAGGSVGAVGIPDCVASGARAASSALEFLGVERALERSSERPH
jgi:oxygen-dependent protoporphyrinogen oxidase